MQQAKLIWIYFSFFLSQLFRNYVANKVQRRFEVYYDPYTQSVWVLDDLKKLENVSSQIESDIHRMKSAIQKLEMVKD